jgi:hypothetical protein
MMNMVLFDLDGPVIDTDYLHALPSGTVDGARGGTVRIRATGEVSR